MSNIKKLFSGLGQQGIIHLLPLLLILVGIIGGVYLVQKEGFQLFKPKASANVIEWQVPSPSGSDPDNCITSVDPDNNYATAVCSKVKLKFNLPNPSTDAGPNMSLVKTVYAQEFVEDGKCGFRGLNSIGIPGTDKVSKCPSDTQCILVERDGKKGAECVQKPNAGEGWSCIENNTTRHKDDLPWLPFVGHTNIKCPPDKPVCKPEGNSATCVPKEEAPPTAEESTSQQPSTAEPTSKLISDNLEGEEGEDSPDASQPINNSPKGEVSVAENGQVDFYWKGPESAKRYRLLISDLGKPNEKNTNRGCPAGYEGYFYCTERHLDNEYINYEESAKGGAIAIKGFEFQDGSEYDWWVDALDENGKTISTSSGFRIKISKTAKSEPVAVTGGRAGAAGGQAPVAGGTGAGGTGAGTTGTQIGTCQGAPIIQNPDGSKVIDAPCDHNPPVCAGIGERPAGYSWKALCSSACTSNADCAQYANTTSGYVDSKTSYWCYGFKSGARCLKLEYDGESGAATAPTATKTPASTASGKAVYYRYAVSYRVPQNTPWQRITDTISIDLQNASPGGFQSIFFEFADSNQQLVRINNQDYLIAYVQFVAPGTTAGPTEAPQATQTPTPAAGTEACPVANYRSYDIGTLMQKCKNDLTKLTALDTTVLGSFSNQDLLEIAKAADGADGPYKFLAKFDDNRLSSFDLEVLKKLPEERINRLPENLKNAIKGTGTSSESANCENVSIRSVGTGSAGATVRVNFTGSPVSLKVWLSSNSDIDKDFGQVSSWTPVKTVSNPLSGANYDITYDMATAGLSKGTHAVLVSLHNSYGQILDGNPGGVVNPNCASSINIQ